MEHWKDRLQVETCIMGYDAPEYKVNTEAHQLLQEFFHTRYKATLLPPYLTKKMIQDAKDRQNTR